MNTLSDIVEIYRALENRSEHDSTLEGDIFVRDDAMRSTLLSSEDDETSTDLGLSILSDPEDIEIGGAVRIRLFPPRRIPVFSNLSSFLGNGSRFLEPVGDFYIVDDNWYSGDPEQPVAANNLEALHQVMTQIGESAMVVDKEKRKLLFADNAGLVDLPVNILPDDLSAVTPEAAEEFVNFCSDTLHRQHRLEAVSSVAIQLTRGMPAHDRLHYLLRNLARVLSDAKSQHAVFLSAFSYEKVRDEIESIKVEYTTKIHKVLSDIQSQLLGIPAATVIVATQMKTTTQTGSEFVTNTAVLLGAWIFGIFLILLLRNQFHTLEVIETEVNRQKKQLSSELPEVANKFDNVFDTIYKRIQHQYTILRTVDIVVLLGLLLSCYAFWIFSSEAIKTLLQI